ncbi:hypothetical protein [Nannocystis punicea]|uniref:Uncharacterized protein n=1 Tax=Nannocystis punicea TaxID=2995304 RepID=A0ABY7H672_9BACT|nr:hypothetical protein [Nannocystis poenicansa]WAS94776.1 hypothetical protein O0S08_01335 [Nannocystis poenicansa]
MSRPGDFESSATETVGPSGDPGGGPATTEPDPGTTTTSATTPNPTTGPGDDPVTSSTTTGSAPSSTTRDSDGFITPPDGGTHGPHCDQWVQDCPEGQKCSPFADDGGNSWNNLKCVDVVRDPGGLYEPCENFGANASGEDSCDVGLLCWEGKCLGMCTGSPDKPGCTDPDASCILTSEGVLTLCLPKCDPLKQDCDPGQVCIPSPFDFVCVIDSSGEDGQLFDECEFANACDPGLFCVDPQLASECDPQFVGCCQPFCDITQPNTCPGQGQECLSWWGQDPPQPGHEKLGICGLPF